MHRRDACCVSKLALGHRQLASVVLSKPHSSHPYYQLAEDMGDPAVSLAPADVRDPLPEDRGVDKRLSPEGARDPRIPLAKVTEVLVLNETAPARGKGPDADVQNTQVKALHVGKIASDVERRNLALTFARD